MSECFACALVLCLSVLAVVPSRAADATQDTFVDIHFHADARPIGGGELPKVAEWMKSNRVTQLIVLQFDNTQPRSDAEARQITENFKAYQGRIYRFVVMHPEDVQSAEEAAVALKKMKEEGAIGFGEHYGRGLNFDDPKCMHLYSACAEVGLPVLFHMDQSNNRDDDELSHLENALKTYPKCVFIGHGPGFWAKMKVVDQMLGRYANLYADISAGSGAKALGRDKANSQAFVTRHADRVMFGTDGGSWSYGKAPPPQFALVKSLDLPPDVEEKVRGGNAIRLFGLVHP